MKLMLLKRAVFAVLFFEVWAFGRPNEAQDGQSAHFQLKERARESPAFRGLQSKGPKGKSKKSMKSMMRTKGKSKKIIPPKTQLPTITQLPMPSAAAATPSPSTYGIPPSTTSVPTTANSLSPTTFPFVTFMPTIGASVAPTYLISIMPSGLPTKARGSIRPSTPPQSRPTRKPETKPSSAPTAKTSAPHTQSPPTQGPPKPPQPPPTPTQIQPQTSPPSIPPSQVAGPKVVDLSPFTLNYTLTRPRIPFRTEYIELATVTGVYLENFFRSFFHNSSGTELGAVIVIYNSASIFFGSPIEVEFGAVASFSSNSTSVPTAKQLDGVLVMAFTGSHVAGYVNFIQHQLAATNTFATTENVTFVTSPNPTKKSTSTINEMASGGGMGQGNSGNALSKVAISVGAIAVVALLGSAIALYRRHKRFDPTTNIDKPPPSYLTVAAGTCEESTMADSSSFERHQKYGGVHGEHKPKLASPKWRDFAPEAGESYKKTPLQIMSEMDLSSAFKEVPQHS